MTKVTTILVLFAAGTLPFGANAMAQTHLTAVIPFAFHTGQSSMPAGRYQVNVQRTNGASTVVMIRNSDTHQNAAVLTRYEVPYPARTEKPQLIFACGTETCSLQQIKTGESALIASPRNQQVAHERLASVGLTRAE